MARSHAPPSSLLDRSRTAASRPGASPPASTESSIRSRRLACSAPVNFSCVFRGAAANLPTPDTAAPSTSRMHAAGLEGKTEVGDVGMAAALPVSSPSPPLDSSLSSTSMSRVGVAVVVRLQPDQKMAKWARSRRKPGRLLRPSTARVLHGFTSDTAPEFDIFTNHSCGVEGRQTRGPGSDHANSTRFSSVQRRIQCCSCCSHN